jgi:hypothetical protein
VLTALLVLLGAVAVAGYCALVLSARCDDC